MRILCRTLPAVAAATAVLGLACPAGPAPPPAAPGWQAPDWQDGETFEYHVVRGDSVLYETRVVLEFDEELVTLAEGRRPVPTAVVTTTVRPVKAPTFFFDSSTVVFRRDSILPLRSRRSLETDLAWFETEATYSPGRVHIRRHSVDGVGDTSFSVSGAVLDQDMLWTALRAFPPEPGAARELTVVLPLELRQRQARLKVLGTLLVATPLDTVVCRVYEYTFGTRENRFWYEIEPPRRLLGFSDPANNLTTLLVGYNPGHTAPVPRAVSDLPSP